MASHFSSIGMQVDSAEDMHALLEKAVEDVEKIPCSGGAYLRWSTWEGAELWLQADKAGAIVGVTPYFSGKAEFRVGVTAAVERPDDTTMEGAVHGWADPPGDDPESGEYPLVFDLVDKALYGNLDYPFVTRVRLSAFAHELSIYESEKSFAEAQEGEIGFASESFIPSGLFSSEPDAGETAPPASLAIFTGHVLATQELTNPLTNGRYIWMRVRTLGGEIDVVSDPELIETTPVRGAIASGSFWLCGRILDPKIAVKSGLLARMFNRKGKD